MRVLVLAGGPDAEREVSLKSGAAVTAALREAGHIVEQRDIGPNDAGALDWFERWAGDVIFPVLHGAWGEGGGLQALLEARGLAYVGSKRPAASLCMDKHAAKRALERAGVPTPAFELAEPGRAPGLDLPVVVKPAREGSSIALTICHDQAQRDRAVREVSAGYDKTLIERYVTGRELTVGVLGPWPDVGATALPPLEIIPAAGYYDYEAKYHRDDTQYRFDPDLPEALLRRLRDLALEAHAALGARDLSRVDFIVDEGDRPWVLEVNTLPGFTDHSLLPMAAAEAGWPMPSLCETLARLAVEQNAPGA